MLVKRRGFWIPVQNKADMFSNAVEFTLMYSGCKGNNLYLHLKMLSRKKHQQKNFKTYDCISSLKRKVRWGMRKITHVDKKI